MPRPPMMIDATHCQQWQYVDHGGQGSSFSEKCGLDITNFVNVTTDGAGNLNLSTTLMVPGSVASGHNLTATITDNLGNTSEFSLPLSIM